MKLCQSLPKGHCKNQVRTGSNFCEECWEKTRKNFIRNVNRLTRIKKDQDEKPIPG